MPYFYAAGHWNYVRDVLVYLRTMENHPDTLVDKFIVGEPEHVGVTWPSNQRT